MGPGSLNWYRERGLTKIVTYICDEGSVEWLRNTYPDIKVGDGTDREEITERYSCGRIDVRGGDADPAYGDELSVPPMKSEDWYRFSMWLDTFETDFMWTLDQLVELYERANPKIEWWKDEDR
jgi:hypothetical protein